MRQIRVIILKANKVNLFVSVVLFVFWYHSTNLSDTQRITTTCFDPQAIHVKHLKCVL
jgi:hypothetical protein